MKARILVAVFFCFFILWGMNHAVYADVRDGVECNCAKTGDYKGPTSGKTPSEGILPDFEEQEDGTFDSPGKAYTLEITDDGTTTYLRVYPEAGGGAIYSTTLFTSTIAINSDPFQTPGGHNIRAGFSPDDDRFVYHYLDTEGLYHVRLIDLADSGNEVKAYDLAVVSATVAFSPKGAQFLFKWTTASDFFFRVTNAVTGDDVFTEDTAPDFDQTTTPWGFSPDGNLLVYHYVSDVGGNPRHYVRLYTLSAPTAVETAAFDMTISFVDPVAGASLRFSPRGGYLLYAADGLSHNTTILQVRDTGDGSVVWQETFSYATNPGDTGDKFKGAVWGFSSDLKNLNLIYAVDTALNEFSLNLVNLATGQKVINQKPVDIVSGFWQFSPCGDKMALVTQDTSGHLSINLYDTQDGNVAFTDSVVSTVSVAFASTETDHWVTVDEGTPLSMVSNTAGGTCESAPPRWPDGAEISAESITESSVTLSWPSVPDAVNYVLFRDGVQETDTADTSYTVSGLSPDTAYQFTVDAENSAGISSLDGPSVTVTTLPDVTPPTWPEGAAVAVTRAGDSWIDLSWDEALDADIYVILIDGAEAGTTTSDRTYYYAEGLEENTEYMFKIEAEDTAGNRSGNGPSVIGKTEDWTSPEWPEGAELNVTEFGPDCTSLTLSWPPATDNVLLDHYELMMENPNPQSEEDVDIVLGTFPAGTTTFTVEALVPGNTYHFYIRAYDAAGNRSSSLWLSVNTDNQPPTWEGAALNIVDVDATSLTVEWDPASDNVGVLSYQLFVNGVLMDGSIPTYQPTYTISCLLPATAHTIRVEARDDANNVSTTGPQVIAETASGIVPDGFGKTTLESVAPDGSPANAESAASAISDDGRFLVFASSASNLVNGDTNGQRDVFVKNLVTGVIERISIASDGTEGDSHSNNGEISSDGRYVLFQSFADTLVPGYSDGHAYIRDRLNNTTQPAAVSYWGEVPNSYTDPRALSSDGRMVLFSSSASNIVFGDYNGVSDLFLRDLDTDNTALVTVSQNGVHANSSTYFGDMSRDGRYVVMESSATNLVDGETNTSGGIYFKDMETGAVELIAANVPYSSGTPYRDYMQPVVSDDGRFVAYTLNSTDPGWMVFLHDRQTGEARAINETASGMGYSAHPEITPDGRFVVFDSQDGALPGDTNNHGDVLLFDRQEGTLVLISICDCGGQANGGSSDAVITSDGSIIAFSSYAPNLVPLPTDSNGVPDVFVHRMGPETPADSDADGLFDMDELNIYHTDPGKADTDDDGITDGEEIDKGTDPNSSDSDGDGMPDGWEVEHNLNPLINDGSEDADNDGYTNLEEYQAGTDPSAANFPEREEFPWELFYPAFMKHK